MRSLVGRFAQQTNWLLLAIIGLAVFQLSPLLDTGYLGDDAGHSLIRGILGYDDVSLWDYCYDQCRHWVCDVGRFYPLVFPQIYATFYLIPHLFLYKCLILCLVVADLILFARFVHHYTGRDGIAELSILIVVASLQFSYSDDPLLGYSGLLPEIFLFVMLSLSWLGHYLETGKAMWLVASTVVYLVGLLTYEVMYPCFILHVAVAWSVKKSRRDLLTATLPFVLSSLICISLSLLFRWETVSDLPLGYTMRPELRPYLGTMVRQLHGALPVSHYLCGPNLTQAHTLHKSFVLRMALGFLGSFLVSVVTLRRLASIWPSRLSHPWGRLLVFGVALWLFPTLLVCLSQRYQNDIRWGMPQISVYIQYYGVGLILASGITLGVVRLASNKILLALYTCVISGLLGTTLAINNHANRGVTSYLAAGWHNERLNLEAALRAGLADEVPDHSTLILQHRYPWWHDFYIRYFYYQHAGKKLRFTWMLPAAPDPLASRRTLAGLPNEGPPSGLSFVLLDGTTHKDSGYVILGPWDTPARTDDLAISARVFVRGRCVNSTDPLAALAHLGRGLCITDPKRPLEMIRKGNHWALYSWATDRNVLAGLLRSQ